MASRLELEQECLRILAQKDVAVSSTPIPLVTTTTATDNLSVRATALGRGSSQANRYDTCHVKVAEFVVGGPPVGEIAAVDDGGFDLTDKLTTSPAFSNPIQAATDLHLYPKGLTPEYLVARMNSVLRHTDYPYLWAPSMVRDSDFASQDLLLWDAVGTPTIRQFITDPTEMFFGDTILQLLSDAVDEGAKSEPVDVFKDEVLLVATFVKLLSPTLSMKVQLVDTFSGLIKEVTDIDNDEFELVMFNQSVGSDMQVMLRFLSEGTVTQFCVGPPVIIQSQDRRQYVAPSWLTRKEQIKDVVLMIPQTSIGGDRYNGFSLQEKAGVPYGTIRADTFTNRLLVEFAASNYPVFFIVMRPFAELATDAATSVVDKDYLAAKTVANILRDRGDQSWTQWATKASKLASLLGYGGREVIMTEHLTYTS